MEACLGEEEREGEGRRREGGRGRALRGRRRESWRLWEGRKLWRRETEKETEMEREMESKLASEILNMTYPALSLIKMG